MPLITDVADAVVTALNAATLSQSVTSVRFYRPVFELAQLKTLRVSVVPKKIEISSFSRSANQYDVGIDIAVQKKLDTGDNAEIDPLMALVDEIGEFFRLKRLDSVAAIWIKTENAPVYALEHLEQQRVFTSVLTFTFRVVR